MKNYLVYPTKRMYITQTYSDTFSHGVNSTGIPKDFPIDDSCGNDDRDYFYCPCDEMVVKRIYGVGNKGTNTIWLESASEVILANGNESYVTIMIIHPNDDTLKNIKVGEKFKRNEAIFREGNDGNATGYHFHMSVSASKYVSGGWVQNDKGAWVIKGSPVKPEDAFWVDEKLTRVSNTGGLNFRRLIQMIGETVERNEIVEQIEVLVDDLRVRKIPKGVILGYANKGVYNVLEKRDDDDYIWYRIGDEMWIASKEGEWTRSFQVVTNNVNNVVDENEDVNEFVPVKKINLFKVIIDWILKLFRIKK